MIDTVFVVHVTWTDGYDVTDWTESIWSTQEKAEQAIVGYKEQDEEDREYNRLYEVVEWEVG